MRCIILLVILHSLVIALELPSIYPGKMDGLNQFDLSIIEEGNMSINYRDDAKKVINSIAIKINVTDDKKADSVMVRNLVLTKYKDYLVSTNTRLEDNEWVLNISNQYFLIRDGDHCIWILGSNYLIVENGIIESTYHRSRVK